MGRMKAWGIDIADAVQSAEDMSMSDKQIISYVQKTVWPTPSPSTIKDAKELFGKDERYIQKNNS
jgi:hypothetical protein